MLLKLALEHNAHFACSSYVSPELAASAGTAAARGLVILTECGLDPGIDHLLGHELVRRASQVVGDQPATVRFASYCGSNPAVPNDFKYRFSWAPRGVLTALLTPARMIDGGVVTEVAHPWDAVTVQVVNGERFEVYPNRDSVPFVDTYHFPATWTVDDFVRGTLRLDGWHDAWKSVFDELSDASDQRITDLANELASRYPTSATDHDRVVMSVALDVRIENGEHWHGEYILDAVGTADEAATPRLVSVPLACAIVDVVGGAMTPGLHQAADDPAVVGRWLTDLAEEGITAEYRGD
ncbi:MAG: hypothetical protein QOE97_1827 [Pseudonocardiales bacterium]|nr:hypothetical protein [Pseudonocardiales bacterium]